VSLGAGDGERENFHRSARALPATSRHAGNITSRYDTAGHSLNSRLCRVPGNLGTEKDNFGWSVAISDSTAVIGAPGGEPVSSKLSPGVAYLFTKSGNKWSRRQRLPAPGAGDLFGYSVAMARSRILIGMPYYGKVQCGAAYEFMKSGRKWSQRARLVPVGCLGGYNFGFSVAMSGATAVIGAPYANELAGAAYVVNLA
jgi:hypothetical protein